MNVAEASAAFRGKAACEFPPERPLPLDDSELWHWHLDCAACRIKARAELARPHSVSRRAVMRIVLA